MYAVCLLDQRFWLSGTFCTIEMMVIQRWRGDSEIRVLFLVEQKVVSDT